MNTQALIHQAALLNREGIAALACGYGEKAHAHFKNVLEVMGYITQVPNQVQDAAPGTYKPLLASLSPVPIPNLQCDRFFVYDNAFVFQPEARSYNQRDITILSAAAIFNMALTYNQRALVGRPNQSVLRIAARMYDQCLQVLMGLPATGEEEQVNVLKMVILNNRSHIAYELDEYDAAYDALTTVRTLSRRIARQTQMAGTPITSFLQVDAFDEIALNVLVTTRPTTAPCA